MEKHVREAWSGKLCGFSLLHVSTSPVGAIMLKARHAIPIYGLFGCVLLLIGTTSVLGQTSNLDVSICRAVVSRFYAWYVPPTPKAPFPSPLRDKPSLFSPSLRLALQDDKMAQSKSPGVIVGMDFDPFLGSNGPGDHYDVGDVKLQGSHCFAEIWRNPPDISPREGWFKAPLPDVVAELLSQKGEWHFVNFYYPQKGGDLVKILASLRKSRGEN